MAWECKDNPFRFCEENDAVNAPDCIRECDNCEAVCTTESDIDGVITTAVSAECLGLCLENCLNVCNDGEIPEDTGCVPKSQLTDLTITRTDNTFTVEIKSVAGYGSLIEEFLVYLLGDDPLNAVEESDEGMDTETIACQLFFGIV